MSINTFRDIIAWQKAHELVLSVYAVTKSFPRNEEFGLTNQIRRAAVSIPSNIAEGYKRKSNRDSLHFYNIAEGSLKELKYQVLLARDLNYMDKKDYEQISTLADETGRLICGWIKSQKLNS